MLRTLRIRNLVIVEDLTVEFGPGLNLLTGETGAGKSILVDALGLISGGRADRRLIRAGAERAIVEALFDTDESSAAGRWARENDSGERSHEPQIVVRRELPAGGSGRILINGSPATLAMLAELGRSLLELHGQHEFRSLLSPERHLAALDQFAGAAEQTAQVAALHDEVLRARATRDRLSRASAERGERVEQLQSLVREIDALAPRPGESAELERERAILRNAARVSELLNRVVELTYEGETTAASLAAGAAREAGELARIDPELEEIARRIAGAAVEIEDAGSALRAYRERIDFHPGRLEAIEARRAALDRLSLRLGAENEEGLLALRADAELEVEELRGLDGQLDTADEAVRSAEAGYASAALALRDGRIGAARRLAGAMAEQLRALALDKAEFEVRLSEPPGERIDADGGPIALTARGADRAEFLLAANPGEPPGPLHKVASGGELSRVMLALHAAAGDDGEGRVIVFDEVDAGIGGAVADAVGSRLAQLARRYQVLCVTHLPQVAAYADEHYSVRKRLRAGRTLTEIAGLDKSERVDELARMLGGRRTTAASRRHASELLSAASRLARAR